jgi:hypothetical protein
MSTSSDENDDTYKTVDINDRKSVLRKFRQFKQENSCNCEKHVKKENLNTHFIRIIKKIIECLKKGTKPNNKKFIYFEIENYHTNDIWRKLDETYYREKELLDQKMQLKPGPLSHKSVNSAFLKDFFRESAMVEFYKLILLLLFHIRIVKILEFNFKIRCCKEDNRCGDCNQKWCEFEEFMYDDYIQDILKY